LSKIIKVQESLDENSCRPHLFPKLVDEEFEQGMLSNKKSDNFTPGCPQALKDSSKKHFEAFFQENTEVAELGPSEANLAEIHANELKESFSKGFLEGENSGILSERQRIEPVLEAFRASAEELGKCRESLIAHFEKDSVELAIAIAEKIVCHEVSTNRETVVDILKRATKETGGNEILKIRINPSDLQFIEESGISLTHLTAENATLEGDGTVPIGGCVIQTDFGCVDATTGHQLEAVAEALREKC